MARSIDQFLDEPEHDARDHTGITGTGGDPSPAFGDGSLGDVTITSYLETSGERHYNNLVIGTGGDIGVESLKKLTIRTQGDLTVNASRSIHADGRGWPAQAGGAGGNSSGSSPNESPGVMLAGLAVAGGGGGGGSGGPGLQAATLLPSGAGGASYPSTLDLATVGRFEAHDLDQSILSHASGATMQLYSLAVPANTLAEEGDYVDVEIAWDWDPQSNNGNFTHLVQYGGQTIFIDSGWTTFDQFATYKVLIRGRIYWSGPATQTAVFAVHFHETTDTHGSFTGINQNFTANLTLSNSTSQSLTANLNRSTTDASTVTKRACLLRLVPKSEPTARNAGGAGVPANVSLNDTPGNGGTSSGAISTSAISRASADYAAQARGLGLMGAGGAGGGGGAGFNTAPAGAGGAVGAVTGVSGFGHGGTGGTTVGNYGGGGGAGGAGGGHLVIWCGGDVTVGAGARISARGGNGGQAGTTGNQGAGEGGGGGGGGGGFVGVFHAGTLTNSGAIDAALGNGAGFGIGFGQNGGAGGFGSAGIVVTQKVA